MMVQPFKISGIVFVHTKQNTKQTIGLSEDEMLLKFNDDKERQQKAIDKGNIRVHGRFYYWDRDIHEDIAGGTHSSKIKS